AQVLAEAPNQLEGLAARDHRAGEVEGLEPLRAADARGFGGIEAGAYELADAPEDEIGALERGHALRQRVRLPEVVGVEERHAIAARLGHALVARGADARSGLRDHAHAAA